MADEIRMYASSDFGDSPEPAEGNPAQDVELEDEEEELIASIPAIVDAGVVEVFLVSEPASCGRGSSKGCKEEGSSQEGSSQESASEESCQRKKLRPRRRLPRRQQRKKLRQRKLLPRRNRPRRP